MTHGPARPATVTAAGVAAVFRAASARGAHQAGPPPLSTPRPLLDPPAPLSAGAEAASGRAAAQHHAAAVGRHHWPAREALPCRVCPGPRPAPRALRPAPPPSQPRPSLRASPRGSAPAFPVLGPAGASGAARALVRAAEGGKRCGERTAGGTALARTESRPARARRGVAGLARSSCETRRAGLLVRDRAGRPGAFDKKSDGEGEGGALGQTLGVRPGRCLSPRTSVCNL